MQSHHSLKVEGLTPVDNGKENQRTDCQHREPRQFENERLARRLRDKGSVLRGHDDPEGTSATDGPYAPPVQTGKKVHTDVVDECRRVHQRIHGNTQAKLVPKL